MIQTKRSLVIALALLAALFAAPFAGVGFAESAAAKMPTGPLILITADGTQHEFIVELAANHRDRSRGLMFREELSPDHGMLFDYGQSRNVAMWMKNTLIPLDMLFIKDDGRVESFRKRTVPHSEQPIPSEGPVRAVLELVGGSVDRLGIQPGDRVDHEIFRQK